jgi:hypothetical protein
MRKFSVWVGGVEVNDYYLTEIQANSLAKQYCDQGYDDVLIEELEGEE